MKPSTETKPEAKRSAWIPILIKFLIVFVLLAAPWPHVGGVFAKAFAVTWQPFVSLLDGVSDYDIVLSNDSPKGDPTAYRTAWQVTAFVQSPDGKKREVLNWMDVRRAAYLPMAVYLALIASIIVSFRGRKEYLRIFYGIVILQFMPMVPLLSFLQQAKIIDLNWNMQVFFLTLYRGLITSPGMTYAVPAILWLLLHRHAISRALSKKGGTEGQGDGSTKLQKQAYVRQ